MISPTNTYDIRIDEKQREIVAEALRRYANGPEGCPDVRDVWQMFDDLPAEEHECPGCLHAFIL